MLFYISFPIVLFLVVLGVFYLYLSKTCEMGQGLSRMEVAYYQSQIDSEQRYQDLINDGSSENAAGRLNLLLVTKEGESFSEDVDSVLQPTEKEEFLGEIVCKPDCDYKDAFGANFRRYHEIIHYVDDVGIGNVVTRRYAKDYTGETRSHKEQIVNFKAAAVAIPKERLLQDLSVYLGDSYFDETFLAQLQMKYRQPIQTIRRRIKEVTVNY